MREIGGIPREEDAKALADYLLTRSITTQLIRRRDGVWGVWVHRDDQLDAARVIFADFMRDPTDPTYRSAAAAARTIRGVEASKERAYRKNVQTMGDRWGAPFYRRAPLTAALAVVSIGVAIYTGLGADYATVQQLTFSVQTWTPDGWHDHRWESIQQGQVYRLLTPIFVHFGVLHLALNLMCLASLGERIEWWKKTWRLALIVVASALVGNVGQFYLTGGNFGGMSGVVYALAGYLWIKGYVSPQEGLSLNSQSAVLLIAWFLLGVVGEQADPGNATLPIHMANFGHGGGLVVGMLFALARF